MTPSPTPIPPGVVVASPAPPAGGAAPVVTPVPAGGSPAPAPAQTMGAGGTINSMLKNTNWVEIGFYILGALALISIIAVSRKRIEQEEVANKKLAMRVDELEGELTKMKSSKKKGVLI